MNLKDRLLLSLSQAELSRNRRFKNLHKGQSCYLIGNGASLKNMDLARFSDKISIGCNSLFLHNDFNMLDCRYYQIPAAFTFYPYRRYYGKLQRNYLGDLYRRKIRENKHVNFFTSLSNSFNMRDKNVYFTHHFGSRHWDLDRCEMDGVFSFMGGAIYAMLGTAIYMGFDSALLVGCDYTFTPAQDFHFFVKGKGSVQENMGWPYGNLFEEIRKRIDVTTIVHSGLQSSALKYLQYEKYMKCNPIYHENTEIVDRRDLDALAKQGVWNIY